ncbi:hypothetical protein BJX64DRAFT_293766 [Aspergillus heterothallicus]
MPSPILYRNFPFFYRSHGRVALKLRGPVRDGIDIGSVEYALTLTLSPLTNKQNKNTKTTTTVTDTIPTISPTDPDSTKPFNYILVATKNPSRQTAEPISPAVTPSQTRQPSLSSSSPASVVYTGATEPAPAKLYHDDDVECH